MDDSRNFLAQWLQFWYEKLSLPFRNASFNFCQIFKLQQAVSIQVLTITLSTTRDQFHAFVTFRYLRPLCSCRFFLFKDFVACGSDKCQLFYLYFTIDFIQPHNKRGYAVYSTCAVVFVFFIAFLGFENLFLWTSPWRKVEWIAH